MGGRELMTWKKRGGGLGSMEREPLTHCDRMEQGRPLGIHHTYSAYTVNTHAHTSREVQVQDTWTRVSAGRKQHATNAVSQMEARTWRSHRHSATHCQALKQGVHEVTQSRVCL